MSNETLKQRYKVAQQKKDGVRAELDHAYDYTFPPESLDQEADAAPNRADLFDSTAPNAVNTLVSNLITFLIPLNSQWASIDIQESVKDSGRVTGDQIWTLEKQNKRLWELLHDSNFYIAAGASLRDCVVSGVGCMAVEMNDNNDKLNYVAIPISQLSIIENGSGNVDTVFRTHRLPARIVKARYKKVPDWVTEENDKNPDALIKVIEAMTPEANKQFKYAIYLEKDWVELDSYVTWHKPFTVFRWSKTTGSAWGDSPVRQALPDIKTVNTMVEQLLASSEYAAFGAWQTDDASLEAKQLKPGEMLLTSDRDSIKPIPFPGNLSIAWNDIQAMQVSIKQRLFADQLPPPDKVKGVVATAINAMQAQFMRHMAVPALSLENEFLREIIKNTVRLAGRNGLMQDMQVEGEPLQIVVKSVVRKGLELEEIQKVLNTLQMVGGIFGPEAVQQAANVPEIIKYIFDRTEFPKDLQQKMTQPEQGGEGGAQAALTPPQGAPDTEQLMQQINQAMTSQA